MVRIESMKQPQTTPDWAAVQAASVSLAGSAPRGRKFMTTQLNKRQSLSNGSNLGFKLIPDALRKRFAADDALLDQIRKRLSVLKSQAVTPGKPEARA